MSSSCHGVEVFLLSAVGSQSSFHRPVTIDGSTTHVYFLFVSCCDFLTRAGVQISATTKRSDHRLKHVLQMSYGFLCRVGSARTIHTTLVNL